MRKHVRPLILRFGCQNNVRLSDDRLKAKRMCKDMHLCSVVQGTEKSVSDSLRMFFTIKTHKIDNPLRVIISENRSWQKPLALYLKRNLDMLPIDDPFLIRSSSEVVAHLTGNNNSSLSACSVDIKDLYYSIPHKELLSCVEACIDGYGAISFQNSSGIPVDKFLELLALYLRSTFSTWEGNIYLQNNGICIGSCLAPVLSDLYLASLDRVVANRLPQCKVVKTFRYVDDYLLVIDTTK